MLYILFQYIIPQYFKENTGWKDREMSYSIFNVLVYYAKISYILLNTLCKYMPRKDN